MMTKQSRAEHSCKVGTPELLVAYHTGRLATAVDRDNSLRLDRHVPGCPQCQEFLAAQSLVWDALDACAPTPAISANFDQALYARIAEEQTGSWWSRTWRRFFQSGELVNWKPVGAMAFACMAVAVGLTLRSENKPKPVALAFDKQEIELIDRALEDFEMLNKMGAPAEGHLEKVDSSGKL